MSNFRTFWTNLRYILYYTKSYNKLTILYSSTQYIILYNIIILTSYTPQISSFFTLQSFEINWKFYFLFCKRKTLIIFHLLINMQNRTVREKFKIFAGASETISSHSELQI